MKKNPLITIGLSPNTEADDVIQAYKVLLSPWHWFNGESRDAVKLWFKNAFNTSFVYDYNSGRSALFQLLQSFGIGNGDEVIVQSFTCVAVPNSVLWTGAKPVFCDIGFSYNLTVETIDKVITPKTKAVIVQHTFGIPAEIDKICDYAKKRNILVIEDCAHAFGAEYKKKMLGSWGDGAIFSFGRDKVVSSVFGGIAIISPHHSIAAEKLQKLHSTLNFNSYYWVFQQLLHPILFSIILPTYRSGIGKILLVIFQKLQLLSFPVYLEEKKGQKPEIFPALYPNGLATLVNHQLQKLVRFNQQRREISTLYYKAFGNTLSKISEVSLADGIFLRYPLHVENNTNLLIMLKKKGILLGNWYHRTIDPDGTNYSSINYTEGSCPFAEIAARHIINLPTNISKEDAIYLIKVIKSKV